MSLNFYDLRIIRGSQHLPFSDIVKIIAACYEQRGDPHLIYDPRFNIWTELAHYPFWLEWVNMLGFWILFLRKHLNFRCYYDETYKRTLAKLNSHHLLKRLHFQIFEEGGMNVHNN